MNSHASRPRLAAVLLAAISALSVGTVSAQELIKADNDTALNLPGSYTAGGPPAADGSNSLTFNTITANRSFALGASIHLSGITHNTTANTVLINSGSGSATLSIGAGGITKALNSTQLLIQPTVILTANQTWTLNASSAGNLVFQGSISDGGFTATINGAGRVDFTNNNVTVGNGIVFNNAQVVVNGGSTVVNFGNANTHDNLLINSGRAVGSVLGNFGAASSFGDGGTSTTISLGGNATSGVLDYTGGNASSNRTITFDRRSTASEIRNSNTASTLTLSGAINNNAGTFTGASSIAFGGAGNITLTGSQQIKDNTNAADATTLNKNGTGTLTITGDHANTSTTAGTYQGATNVNAGLLVVSGTGSINSTSGISVADGAGFIYDSSTALTKTVTLASGARFGGDGTVNSISIGNGVKFVFDGNNTGLTVTGTATFANTFGVDDLVNANGTSISWAEINGGTYTLVANGGSFSNIENFGLGNAFDIGGGRFAYFQNGSLQLVVSAIPEPSAFAALAGLGAVAFAGLRRRRRAA